MSIQLNNLDSIWKSVLELKHGTLDVSSITIDEQHSLAFTISVEDHVMPTGSKRWLWVYDCGIVDFRVTLAGVGKWVVSPFDEKMLFLNDIIRTKESLSFIASNGELKIELLNGDVSGSCVGICTDRRVHHVSTWLFDLSW